jgi:hypothetical protein
MLFRGWDLLEAEVLLEGGKHLNEWPDVQSVSLEVFRERFNVSKADYINPIVLKAEYVQIVVKRSDSLRLLYFFPKHGRPEQGMNDFGQCLPRV